MNFKPKSISIAVVAILGFGMICPLVTHIFLRPPLTTNRGIGAMDYVEDLQRAAFSHCTNRCRYIDRVYKPFDRLARVGGRSYGQVVENALTTPVLLTVIPHQAPLGDVMISVLGFAM